MVHVTIFISTIESIRVVLSTPLFIQPLQFDAIVNKLVK